jgi:rubrerythrin
VIIVFGLNLGGLEWNKFFSTRQENVKTQVFENTQSYIDGKNNELSSLYQEYQQAKTDEDKQILKNVVIQKFGDFDTDKIKTEQLKNFLKQMRGF